MQLGPWGVLVAARGVGAVIAAMAVVGGGSAATGRAYPDLYWILACGVGVWQRPGLRWHGMVRLHVFLIRR